MRSIRRGPATELPDDFVTIDEARALIAGPDQKPVPRERVFALGVEGRLELRRLASRWFVRRESAKALRAELGSA